MRTVNEFTARQGEGHSETVAGGRHETQAAVIIGMKTVVMSPAATYANQRQSVKQSIKNRYLHISEMTYKVLYMS